MERRAVIGSVMLFLLIAVFFASFKIPFMKAESSGSNEWNQTYGGIGYDCAQSMVETSDGGYAIVGYTDSYGEVSVPYQGQGYASWCAPTSLAMVLRYYGEEFHGWDFARDEMLDTDTGVGALSALGDYVEANYPALSVDYRAYVTKITIFDDVKADLDNGYPVILAVGPWPAPLQGHAVVVVGYNETGVFVNDPSGYLFSELLGFSQGNLAGFSFNRAYVSWDDLDDFIVTWPFDSTLTIMGTPDPNSRFGTMYLNLPANVVFYQPSDYQLLENHTTLYLNEGLNWNFTFNGDSSLDNVIEPTCTSLYMELVISNSRSSPAEFNVTWKIMDSLSTVVLSDYKLTGYIDALSQSYEHLATVDLTGLLLQGEPYTIDFSLTDLNGFELDHFATPEFYWASLIIPDFSADIMLTALILLTFVIMLVPIKKKKF